MIDLPEVFSDNNTEGHGEVVHRIDRRTLRPLNQPNCEHDYVHDPTDADNSDQLMVYKCRYCPAGQLRPR